MKTPNDVLDRLVVDHPTPALKQVVGEYREAGTELDLPAWLRSILTEARPIAAAAFQELVAELIAMIEPAPAPKPAA